MTRALFGAGVLGVGVRNSDQEDSSFPLGFWGSRLKTQVPYLRMEGIELGICSRALAGHGHVTCLMCTTLQALTYWSHMSGGPGQAC